MAFGGQPAHRSPAYLVSAYAIQHMYNHYYHGAGEAKQANAHIIYFKRQCI